MSEIRAEVVCDSIYQGSRVTTMRLRMPKMILAEFNTHRTLSRNTASSRANSTTRLIKDACNFIPDEWTKNMKGMSSVESLSPFKSKLADLIWTLSKYSAVISAMCLNKLGTHKQHANRVLEPFMYVDTLVTSTEWDNFFKLRISPLAQPEINELASSMRRALNNSIPEELELDWWHLPLVSKEEKRNHPIAFLTRVSAGRCARVSYTLDSENSLDKDYQLCKRLIRDGHLSPLEHQCRPIEDKEDYLLSNIKGFQQFRKLSETQI